MNSMRKILLPILLLQAVAAFAQPTISAEVASDPLPAQLTPLSFAVPAIAMARDRTGVAIAWAGIDSRISVGRLDATGHFTGPVRSIPTASADPVEGVSPSLAAAPGGVGFILVWLEVHPANVALSQGAYCLLDAGLTPSSSALLAAPLFPITSPPMVRSGKTATWITVQKTAWQVHGDGSLGFPLNAGVAATDMTVANDFPQVIASNRVKGSYTCSPQPGCTAAGGPFRGFCFENCRTYQFNYEVQFASLYDVSTSHIFDFDSDSALAIRSDGRDVLVSWFLGSEAKGGAVVASRLDPSKFVIFPQALAAFQTIGSFGPDSGPTRPDIATDGERYVVVWRIATSIGSHDVVGASIDRAGNIVPLSIATSSEDERDPSVVTVGNGRFLVAYDKLSNGERRIAGRFITFADRTHAVR
jgi:hypothetical protein